MFSINLNDDPEAQVPMERTEQPDPGHGRDEPPEDIQQRCRGSAGGSRDSIPMVIVFSVASINQTLGFVSRHGLRGGRQA